MRNATYGVLVAVGAVLTTGIALTQHPRGSADAVAIDDLALTHEGRIVNAALNEEADEPSYSGPNNQYNANQSYDANGPYNANAAYNAHNQYSANNAYSANDTYNAHNTYSANNTYNANDNYNANHQYNRTATGEGADDGMVEARNTHSNYAFPWLMGEDRNLPLPKPLIVSEN